MALPGMNMLPAFTEVSADQLRQIIEEYPYFGAAHFLLAKKLYTSGQQDYNSAIQQAALHFSNDLWLNYNLHAAEIADVAESPSIQNNIIQTGYQQQDTPAAFTTTETIEADETEEAEEYVEDDLKDAAVSEKISNLLQQQAAILETPVEPAAEIPIENIAPHRIDYFESQGIKLDEDKNADKLGAQLKRFTDWLKQMKRISATQVELKSDEAGESQVQNIAQHSNEVQEVVTETMAEVLVKQGKLEQAIEIYEKLSFNNPSKTAYFAAKIEELKG